MRVRPELSKAPMQAVQLVAAIVNYAGSSEELLEITTRLWPKLRAYHGHTHLRLMPAGKTEGDSIYVELS